MEIPSNQFRIRNKTVQDRVDVTSKKVNTEKAGSASSAGGSEQIALSSKARDIQRAHEAIKASPEIRAEKVNRIKAEIAEGRFKVDSDVLAEKILNEILTESKFLD